MAAVGVNVGQIADIIRSVYDATADLKNSTATTDSMFWSSAPQNAAQPYITFAIVDIAPEYGLGHLDEFHQVMRVSFSVFAKTDSELDDVLNELTMAYAPSATITGGDNYDVLGTRELATVVEQLIEEDVWQGVIDYELTLYRKE